MRRRRARRSRWRGCPRTRWSRSTAWRWSETGRMRKVSLLEWLALAVIVTAGFLLRSRDLAAFKLSPDDGQYMYSARLQSLERSADLGQWIAEDRAWIAELVEDWGHSVMKATTYQHSYLHQFVLRYG